MILPNIIDQYIFFFFGGGGRGGGGVDTVDNCENAVKKKNTFSFRYLFLEINLMTLDLYNHIW